MAQKVVRVPSLSKVPSSGGILNLSEVSSLGKVSSLSRTVSGSRGKHIQKTINNFKITVLCGLLTFVMLRSTIGAGKFGTPEQDYEKLRGRLSELRRAHRRALEEAVRKDRMLAVANQIVYSLDSRVAGEKTKPSILLVVGRQPAQCLHAAQKRSLIRAMKNKIDYCRLHRIEIFNSRAVELGTAGSFLAKVKLLRAAMLLHPEVEWIYWMDSSVVVTDMSFELPMARYQGYNAVIEGFKGAAEWPRLGSFLLRNGGWAVDLLAQWEARWRTGIAAEEVVLAELLRGQEKVLFESTYIVREDEGMAAPAEKDDLNPVLGNDSRPFLADFGRCDSCVAGDNGDIGRCLRQMERALDNADLQLLASNGFAYLQ